MGDMKVPRSSGSDTLRVIRELALLPGHPVLVSGAADPEQVEDVEVVAFVDLRKGLFFSRTSFVAGNEDGIDSGKIPGKGGPSYVSATLELGA